MQFMNSTQILPYFRVIGTSVNQEDVFKWEQIFERRKQTLWFTLAINQVNHITKRIFKITSQRFTCERHLIFVSLKSHLLRCIILMRSKNSFVVTILTTGRWRFRFLIGYFAPSPRLPPQKFEVLTSECNQRIFYHFLKIVDHCRWPKGKTAKMFSWYF